LKEIGALTVSGIPKVESGSISTGIDPWFVGLAILEPAIRASNGDIEDQIEGLIERGGFVGSLAPRIEEGGAIVVGYWEFASLPERSVEVGVKDLHEPGVDIGVEMGRSPLEAVRIYGGHQQQYEWLSDSSNTHGILQRM
jgi:hypothetical protein